MYVFGELLRQFRVRAGLTQHQLADELGVSRNSVIAWETLQSTPRRSSLSREQVIRLREILDLEQDDLNQLLLALRYTLEPLENPSEAKVVRHKAIETEYLKVTRQLELAPGVLLPQQGRRADCYQIFDLPPNYLPRVDVLERVRSRLLAAINTPANMLLTSLNKTPIALHGMGGIGKSVIARALCDDPAVQAAFPGGILWATLGQSRRVLWSMRLWIQALDGRIAEDTPSVESMRLALTQLLKDRTCLLIVDDVWHRIDAEKLYIAAPHCYLLLTTRIAEIARELGAQVLSIPEMTSGDAIKLLERWADGHLAEVTPALKAQIVKRLGYLPLAVRLAGAQLQRKEAAMWLRTFNDMRKLKTSRPATPHDSLEWTFQLSLDDLDAQMCRLYLALAIFQEDEATPHVTIERLWQGLAGLNEEATGDLLYDLASRALLELIPHGASPTVRLHDLLRKFISVKLGDTERREAHHALLAGYRTACKEDSWSSAEDDGYLYDHLTYHLAASDSWDELNGLFADQRWMQMRVPQRAFTYDRYLADLSLAFERAMTEACNQIDADQEPTSLANGIRHVLIRTSINSLAENYPPELIARALKVGTWTSQRAMSIAERIPQLEQRANTYLAVLETGQLDPAQQEQAQGFILDYAATLSTAEAQAKMLSKLTPRLSGDLLERTLQVALVMTDPWAKAHLLVALLPHLPSERQKQTIKQALEATLIVSWDRERTELFAQLGPLLAESEPLLAQALNAILAEADDLMQGDMLVVLLPNLTAAQLEFTLDAILALPAGIAQIKLLGVLSQRLNALQVARALQVSLATQDEVLRARMLEALARRLEGNFFTRAFEEMQSMTDPCARALAFAALSYRHSWTEDLIKQAHQAALTLLEHSYIGHLAYLTQHLPDEPRAQVLDEVLQAAPATLDPMWRAELLKELIPLLTEAQLEQVLNTALHEEEGTRAYLLGILVSFLPERQLQQVLQAAEQIESLYWRIHVMHQLVPYLNDEQRTQALSNTLETILAVPEERARAEPLKRLSPLLTGDPLARAWKATLEIKDELVRTHLLAQLASLLTGDLLEQALQDTLTMPGAVAYVEVIVALSAYVQDEHRKRALTSALEAARTVTDERVRARLLIRVTSLLPEDQREQTVKEVYRIISSITNPWDRAERLVELLPLLVNESRQRALIDTWEAMLAVKEERVLARLLAALAPYLPDELLEQALEHASAMVNGLAQVEAQAMLAPRLPEERRDQLFTRAIQVAMNTADVSARAQMLAVLAHQLTGVQQQEVIVGALETALLVSSEWTQVIVLAVLAPHLPEDLLKRTLDAVLAHNNLWVKIQLLRVFAPYVKGDLQKQVLEAVQAIEDSWLRAQVLVAFVPVVIQPAPLITSIRQTLVETLLLLQKRPHEDILNSYLFKEFFTPPFFSSETLEAIALHIVEICQEWHWL